ncbi:hypothetical protein FRC09_002261 [Ceratobasidium sp. 395]|nr:hypothetical protein FRC09_002261 [Ceratobasidium sp. 395]
MPGSHLDRTGFRHLVMGIATIATLTGVMWASSSFLGSMSGKSLAFTPTIEDTYSRISRYTIPIIVLNSSVALIIFIMSLVVDWHFNVSLPAYIEYAWVSAAWCIQLVSIIIIASVASPYDLCQAKDVAPSDTWSRDALCSNWKAVLASSVIALVALALHLSWHLMFRLCHRTALANSLTVPINIWTTPLPRKYPISSPEKSRRQAGKASMALSEVPHSPANSYTSTPVTASHTGYSAEGSPRVPGDDLEKALSSDNVSVASSKVVVITPPGLEAAIETRRSLAT